MSLGGDAQEPLDGFLFVSAVASRIDSNGSKLASFTPAFDSQSGNSKNLGNFADSKQIREIIEVKCLCCHLMHKLSL